MTTEYTTNTNLIFRCRFGYNNYIEIYPDCFWIIYNLGKPRRIPFISHNPTGSAAHIQGALGYAQFILEQSGELNYLRID